MGRCKETKLHCLHTPDLHFALIYHQQPWHWLCRKNIWLYFPWGRLSNTFTISRVVKLYKIQMYFYVFLNNLNMTNIKIPAYLAADGPCLAGVWLPVHGDWLPWPQGQATTAPPWGQPTNHKVWCHTQHLIPGTAPGWGRGRSENGLLIVI